MVLASPKHRTHWLLLSLYHLLCTDNSHVASDRRKLHRGEGTEYLKIKKHNHIANTKQNQDHLFLRIPSKIKVPVFFQNTNENQDLFFSSEPSKIKIPMFLGCQSKQDLHLNQYQWALFTLTKPRSHFAINLC